MTEDDDMLEATRAKLDRAIEPNEAVTVELSTLPTEALARLDRLASTSLLASALAHEIANPLGGLLEAHAAIEERVRDMRRRGATAAGDVDALGNDLDLASTCAGAITDLVHDFQSFLRPSKTVGPVLVDVRDAVERALRIAGPRVRAIARVDLDLVDVPPVEAQASRIVQIVLNLVLNAAEALAQRARDQNFVAVRVSGAAGRVLIEVSDNGGGLPASVRERVFEPGVTEKSGRAGAGLGLAISRELARKMGGDIAVSSLPGAGTTFLVSLPATA
jgi:two-component system cell cycle sensor histidine kinase/response regulator CckA